MADYVRWFRDITIADVAAVGGKNASLGEMYRELAPQGVRVPNGFAVTADGYRRFLETNQLEDRIRGALDGLDLGNVEDLRVRGSRVRELIVAAELPQDLREAILAAYRELGA